MKKLVNRYLIEKSDETHIQFFRYIFVGGLATVADMGTLFLLTNYLDVFYLLSAAIGFVLGLSVNYAISIFWVFESTGDFKKEFTLFAAIGIGGLVLNEIIIWGLVDYAGLFYMLAKMISVVVVLFWNFGMRKKFVFKNK